MILCKCGSPLNHCAVCGKRLVIKFPKAPALALVPPAPPVPIPPPVAADVLDYHNALTLLNECSRALDTEEPVVDVDALVKRVDNFLDRKRKRLPSNPADARFLPLTASVVQRALRPGERLTSFVVQPDGLSARVSVFNESVNRYIHNILVVLGPERK